MIRYFSADFIIPVNSEPIERGVVSVNDRGEIVGIYRPGHARLDGEPIARFDGLIVPGFINSHCHLELSHLKGRIPGGEGLLPFLTSILEIRQAEEQQIQEAMEKADKIMYDNGIVAVADISNNILSKKVKESSPVYYHTFVEFMGFDPAKAESIFKEALELLREFAPLQASLAPHAPYSVSRELLRLLKKNREGRYELTSMHNQESEEENEFFKYRTGAFCDFYKKLGVSLDHFKVQARNSVRAVVPLFSERQRLLLVHNTYSNMKDLYFVERVSRDVHWCFCPNANLYIERQLPKIDMFMAHDFHITLGTDSLASNNGLCILSELKTIKEHFPSIPFAETLRWATINGARFLGIDDRFGSIEVGKRPGLNLISHTDRLELTSRSVVRKLV